MTTAYITTIGSGTTADITTIGSGTAAHHRISHASIEVSVDDRGDIRPQRSSGPRTYPTCSSRSAPRGRWPSSSARPTARPGKPLWPVEAGPSARFRHDGPMTEPVAGEFSSSRIAQAGGAGRGSARSAHIGAAVHASENAALAAGRAWVDPDRISFVAALRITRRSLSHSDFSPHNRNGVTDLCTARSPNSPSASIQHVASAPTRASSNARSSSGQPNALTTRTGPNRTVTRRYPYSLTKRYWL
jgi:hypothetical protein